MNKTLPPFSNWSVAVSNVAEMSLLRSPIPVIHGCTNRLAIDSRMYPLLAVSLTETGI